MRMTYDSLATAYFSHRGWVTRQGTRYCSGQTTFFPPRQTGLDSRRGGLQFFTRGNRARRFRWLAGILEDFPFSSPLRSGDAPFSPRSPFISSQDVDAKSRPNLSVNGTIRASRIRRVGKGHIRRLNTADRRTGTYLERVAHGHKGRRTLDSPRHELVRLNVSLRARSLEAVQVGQKRWIGERNGTWPLLRTHPGIRLERFRKTKELRNRDGRTGNRTRVLPNANPSAVAERLTCSPPTNANRVQPPAGVTLGFLLVGIAPDDAAGRRVFSGISRFPGPFIPALLYSHLNHPHWLSRPRYVDQLVVSLAAPEFDVLLGIAFRETSHDAFATLAPFACDTSARREAFISTLWPHTRSLDNFSLPLLPTPDLLLLSPPHPARLPPRRSGLNPRPAHFGPSHVGIVPDDAVGRRVFSEVSRLPRPLTPAPFHTHLNNPHRLSRTLF
ncbi:hypothetical protein PR048_031616 [Dryococelus australis]|uniref:Uncharacterized protein n=1 Tax=Dryococelus australis TaxID=614101 RepID=A0ABQ9G9U0_9NEOP|nr:hypothetical protein PR048_031616 [Dryococelus australis]